MKTLDEVIAELEDEGLFTDALHYLKEYKANQEDPDGDHQQLEKARALLQEFFANPPLTWDELKTMEGKPVWVEPANEWILISFAGENRIFFIEKTCNEYSFPKEEYPERWQAYRKER